MNENKEKSPSIKTINGSTEELIEISTHRRVWERKKRKLITFLTPALGAIAFVFMVLFIVYHSLYKNALKGEEYCTNEDCIDTANTLLQILDRSKDPCDDFYSFACGLYSHTHPIPEGAIYRSWFQEGEEKIASMVQTVVEDSSDEKKSTRMHKVRSFYKSCMDTVQIEEMGLKPLYDLLNLMGLPKYPSAETAEFFNLGRTLGLLQRHLNLDVLVQLSFEKGAIREGGPNDTYILQISPASPRDVASLNNYFTIESPLVSNIRRDPNTFNMPAVLSPQQALEQRLKFMTTIMKIILNDLEEWGDKNDTELMKDSFKIVVFMATLGEALATAQNSTQGDVEQMTFADLQFVLDDTTVSGRTILWKDFLDGMFGGDAAYWVYNYEEDLVYIDTLNTFKALLNFLGTHQIVTIQRYVWWAVVSEYARYTTEEMAAVYRRLQEAVIGKSGGIARTRTCVDYVRRYFPLAVAKEIITTFHLTEHSHKVAEMLDDIVNEFEDLVKVIHWMDSATKQLNIQKAKSVSHVIGYEEAIFDDNLIEEYYRELDIGNDQFLRNIAAFNAWELEKVIVVLKQGNDSIFGPLAEVTNPLQVNAYYARTTNAIYVPAGILQRPFYYRGLEALNYGAIGSILGHELTHGFDSEGKNYDRHGKVRKQIWSPEITEEFTNRAKCFVKQYGSFNLTENKRLDGEFTLAENIADNGGIRESYYAYQTFIKRNGPEPKLPGLENFTHEQLLFISFANIWCESSTESYRELAATDNHSPNRVRVIAALQNMKEFAESFHCPAESFMNPKTKCIIW